MKTQLLFDDILSVWHSCEEQSVQIALFRIDTVFISARYLAGYLTAYTLLYLAWKTNVPDAVRLAKAVTLGKASTPLLATYPGCGWVWGDLENPRIRVTSLPEFD